MPDIKLPSGGSYIVEPVSVYEYDAYGIARVTRSVDLKGPYRYGFQGMLRMSEVAPSTTIINDYATLFRTYDARTGRWTSHDPILQPWESTYAGLAGNPAMLTDWYGLTTGGGDQRAASNSDASKPGGTTPPSSTSSSSTSQTGGGQQVSWMMPPIPAVQLQEFRQAIQWSNKVIKDGEEKKRKEKEEEDRRYLKPTSLLEKPERSQSDATAVKDPQLRVKVLPPLNTAVISRPTFSEADAERARLALERQRVLEFWGGPAAGGGNKWVDRALILTNLLGMLGGAGIASGARKPLPITPAPRLQIVRPLYSVPALVAFQKPLSLPGTRLNITTKAAVHILWGDKTGGGHLWPGAPKKSAFPEDWSPLDVITAIVDVANSPNSTVKPGRRGRTIFSGTRDGIDIEVVVGSPDEGGDIITGYPTNVQRNP